MNELIATHENENGEIFTHELETDHSADEESFTMSDETGQQNMVMWLSVGFIGVILVGFILFVYMYRKKK